MSNETRSRRRRVTDWLGTLPGDPRAYAWLGFIIALACLFKAIPSKSTYMWVSSDTLWPVNLFTDIFRDGYSFRGWEFSIAPCWFPDIALVGLCYFFLRNAILTTLVAGSVQFIILIAGFCLCWRALGLANRKLLDTLTVGVGIAIVIWVAFHSDVLYPGFYQFLLPQTHVGNLIMHVYAIWLALLMVQSPPDGKRRAVAVGFALVCGAAGFSNLMFFPHTMLPLSIALGALAFARALPLRRATFPVLLGWPSALAGAIIYRVFFTAMSMDAQASTGWNAWRQAAHTFYAGVAAAFARNDLQHIVAVLWLAACVAVGCRLLWRLRGTAGNSLKEGRAALSLFLLTSAGASVFGPATMIMGGSNGLTTLNNYRWTMHYMHPTFLFPLFAWPSILGLLPAVRLSMLRARGLALATAVTCFIAPVTAFARIPVPPVSLSDYVPDFVRALDQEARQYGMKYGIAGYWQARLITLLSRTGLRAYPVDGSMRSFPIVSNREWFVKSVSDRTSAPCFSFVVLNDPLWKLTRASAVRVAGEPSYELDTAGLPVLVYSNGVARSPRCIVFPLAPDPAEKIPEMVRPLSRFVSGMSSSVVTLRTTSSERMNIPVRVRNTGTEEWSSSGKFPVTLSYKWFKAGQMLPYEGERTMLPGAVAPGSAVSLSALVVTPAEPGTYTLRMSLVQEGVAWFMSKGTSWLDIETVVAPAGDNQEDKR